MQWLTSAIIFLDLGMVNEEPSIPISLIQERISGQFGYKVSYRKAWRAKQKAIALNFGDWDQSYELLPRWLEHRQSVSPGAVYKLETSEFVFENCVDNHFQKFY